VTKQAFERDLQAHIDTMEDPRIQKMLTSVLSMYREYAFFTAPTYADFDSDSDAFEKAIKDLLKQMRAAEMEGAAASADEALDRLRN